MKKIESFDELMSCQVDDVLRLELPNDSYGLSKIIGVDVFGPVYPGQALVKRNKNLSVSVLDVCFKINDNGTKYNIFIWISEATFQSFELFLMTEETEFSAK